MRYETLFLALTAGLINCEQERFNSALGRLEEAFEGLELRRQRVPGHSSIGASTRKSQSLTLVDWIQELRAQGLPRAGTPGVVGRVPAAAAKREPTRELISDVEGGSGRSLIIEQSGACTLYEMTTENSSPYLISPGGFARWISRQAEPELIWAKVLEEINEFNRMNGFEPVAPDEHDAYFASSLGAHIFDLIGDRCLEVAQSTSTGSGLELEISGDDQKYFERGDREEQVHLMLGGSVEDFLPFDQLLQVRGSVTGPELVRLFDAQTAAPQVWSQVEKALSGMGEISSEKTIVETRRVVAGLSTLRLELFGNALIARMQNACHAAAARTIITPEFQGRLMTHLETLSPEERARYVPSEKRLRFAPNREPWRHFCFIEKGPYQERLSGDLDQAVTTMQKVLRQAYAFATRTESSFSKTIALAGFVLSREAEGLFVHDDGFEKLKPVLSKQGYTEESQALLEEESRVIGVLKSLGYTNLQLRALCACAIADVFGGMGSWNEIYFADPADQRESEEVSSAIAESIYELQAGALVSLNAPLAQASI